MVLDLYLDVYVYPIERSIYHVTPTISFGQTREDIIPSAVHRLIAGRNNYRLSAKLAPGVQRTFPLAKRLNGSSLSRISLILAVVVERETY